MAGRECFSSRLGFVLIAAGCAIGLGNVWRFPYIVGQYGGAIFALIYLAFLFLFGIPLLTVELAAGRASRRSLAGSFESLERRGSRWHLHKYWMIFGNYVLMSFYTVVAGWMLLYCLRGFAGGFSPGTDAGQTFGAMLSSPAAMLAGMLAVIAAGFAVCSGGLRRGVERVTKPLMLCLFALMVFLAVRSCFLPGFGEGLAYYLAPNPEHFSRHSLIEVLSAAMAQAFFTLSIGIGAIQIFATYAPGGRTLLSESVSIALLDTLVALISGLIIFPACFSYNVEPDQGPGLIFVTLVSIFSHMENGGFWGGLFFLFMTFAALSTLVAVFENIIAISMEMFGVSRGRAVLANCAVIVLVSLPCLLGFNLWSGAHPLGGSSTILDLEDFIISNNILPLGALVYLLFVTRGWGFDRFLEEANRGAGPVIPRQVEKYFRWVLPAAIALLVLNGYTAVFG